MGTQVGHWARALGTPHGLGQHMPRVPAGPIGLTEPIPRVTATVQCLLDGHFVVVVPRGLGTQPYNLDSVRLASSQPGCEPLGLSESFVMFRFAVTQCGTTLQVGMGNHHPGPPQPHLRDLDPMAVPITGD